MGCYPANYLIGRILFSKRQAFTHDIFILMRLLRISYISIVFLNSKLDWIRVTRPFATNQRLNQSCSKLLNVNRQDPFDLHVLGILPALILSQGQTLQK